MTSVKMSSSVDGLPKQFVTSLRILFDILDEDRTGYVRLCDIESRWHEEGVRGLPSGVIDTLRKVAPRNGKLSFENFVTGLKLSLLKNNPLTTTVSGSNQNGLGKENKGTVRERPVSAPVKTTSRPQTRQSDVHQSSQGYNERKQSNQRIRPQMGTQVMTNTATVRPVLQSHNIELRNQIYNREQLQQASIKQQSKNDATAYVDKDRRSVPSNLNNQAEEKKYHARKGNQKTQNQRPKSVEIQRSRDFNDFSAVPPGRPEKPPPYRSPADRDQIRPDRPPPYKRPSDHEAPPTIPPRNVDGRIMHELKNWQKVNMVTTQQGREGHLHTVNSDSKLLDKNRQSGNEIYVNIEQVRKQAANIEKSSSSQALPRTSVRRQNSRRHTLSNGIDYNVIRRMKQLEQEKDALLQGLEVVDRARDWYHKQVSIVTEKQNYAEKTSCSDVTLQSNQERMDFVRGRISDVNLNLKALMESTEKGFPAHMNLAVNSNVFSEDSSVKWLKVQNKQLTKEVGSKSDKITQLEKEKASLIRDLFEARSKHKTNYDDTTFM